ncbi:MAG: DUF4397 domain-containing protein [Bacteroidetes bacterium]|nr:DUF4397 domain-containing protein [Bacteroidota bacterium]
MKRSNSIITGLLLAVSAIAVSCKREVPQLAPIQTNFSNNASIQVFSATLKATRNYVYVDNVPVSGAALAQGGVFPGTAFSFMVPSGVRNLLIKDTLSTSTQVPLSFSQAFDGGKNYTIFTYDTITSIKQVTVLDNIVVPSDTAARLRFANFVYNPAVSVPNVDVYSLRKFNGTPVYGSTAVLNNANVFAPNFAGQTPLFSNVATNTVTDFVPYPSITTDTLYVFPAGATSPLIAKGAVISLVPTRSYTSAFYGSYRGALSTRSVATFVTY